jgi:predicted TIM-barrel fold metal-dependent hydrolase
MAAEAKSNPLPTIDVHMHLAGTGCCNSGCWVSPDFRQRYTFKLLKLIHRISNRQMESTIDKDWAANIARLVRESGIDYGVVLGFDGVYSRKDGSFSDEHSQMVIPAEWVFSVCREHGNLLPAPSINPYRKGALKILDYCIRNGAVCIKWLPAAQDINPDDAQIDEFYRMCPAANLPVLVHMGGEKTFKTVTAAFNNVERLKRPLELGVKVICAHTATRIIGTSEADQIPKLKGLLREYPHLWVDNSGMCNPSRFAHVPVLAKDEEITSRTLYGSDWPVPSNAAYFLPQLGLRKVISLERMRSPLDRDVAIKREFGYPDATLTNHHNVLANLDRWIAIRQ